MSLEEAISLNCTHLTLNTVIVVVLAMVKRLSDLSLLRITPKAMQVMEDSVAFQPLLWDKKAWLNHLYGHTITLNTQRMNASVL